MNYITISANQDIVHDIAIMLFYIDNEPCFEAFKNAKPMTLLEARYCKRQHDIYYNNEQWFVSTILSENEFNLKYKKK